MGNENKLLLVREIIYKSPSMRNLMEQVSLVAKSKNAILILGENGTGKDLVAAHIYELSDVSDKKHFVSVNCEAMQESVLESELFGHVKGAFSGAYTDKKGLIEMSEGGILFLDEVGALSLRLQTKLLRFLQDGEIYRMGESTPICVNTRLICSSSKELEKEVREKNFRSDLYYRINAISLRVPPLRSRLEDISVICEYFLKQAHFRSQGEDESYVQSEAKSFSEEALKYLKKYNWIGNVRELKNTCESLHLLSSGQVIEPSDLPLHFHKIDTISTSFKMAYDPESSLYDVEKTYVLLAMNYHGRNKAKVAKSLGVSNKTLYNKLHQYGVFDKYSYHKK